jgi:hypothetical protein
MKTLGIVMTALAVSASTATAQGRGNGRSVPPGQMPPAGLCRVWYEGLPPGRQPAATDCRTAERIAARDRDARVVYGDNPNARTGRRLPRAVARQGQSYDFAFDNGYRDGVEKGREDAGDRDVYDPSRHSRYRSADRGYESEYGSKDGYRSRYRHGFVEGYEAGYGYVPLYR